MNYTVGNQTLAPLAFTKTSLEIAELVFLVVIGVLILVGNCLVILAFIFGPRSLRSHTNIFVVNLAVSDLMVGCLSLPFWIVYRADLTLVNRNVYASFIAVDILCGTTSILSLAAISLERMFAVKFPTTHFNLDSKPILVGVAVTWVLGLVFTGSKFAVKTPAALRAYTASIFALAFLVPLMMIIVSYILIFFAAVKMMNEANQPGKLSREIHVAKTISVIIALFIFCWMPFFITNMVWVFCTTYCKARSKYKWVVYISKMMHYSNSMMNFFVYAVRLPDFRRAFKAILFNCDTSGLRERVRSFSESIVTRGRSASERLSFIHDHHSQHHDHADNNNADTKHSPSQHTSNKSKHHKQCRLSNCTEVSTVDTAWSPSINGSSNTTSSSSNPLLSSLNGHVLNLDMIVSSI